MKVTFYSMKFWLIFLCVFPFCLHAQDPSWWPKNQGAPANDYEVARIGHLKNMALQSMNALNAALAVFSLPGGGAGEEVWRLVNGWRVDPENASSAWRTQDVNEVVRQGQLKAVAKPFYDRLAQLGLWPRGYHVSGSSTAGLPAVFTQTPYNSPPWWQPVPVSPAEWAATPRYPWKFWVRSSQWAALGRQNLRLEPANIGQTKFVFHFDPAVLLSSTTYVVNGQTRTYLTNGVPTDSDGDGVADLVERLLGTDLGIADAVPAMLVKQQQTGTGAGQLSDETAARFLMQAAWGPSWEAITDLKTKGITTWLDEQMNESHAFYGFRPSDVGMSAIPWADGQGAMIWQNLWFDWPGAPAGTPSPRLYPASTSSYADLDTAWASVAGAAAERGPLSLSWMPHRGVEPYVFYQHWRKLVKDRAVWQAELNETPPARSGDARTNSRAWPYELSYVDATDAQRTARWLDSGMDDAWLRRVLYDPDQLRQRMTWALSQILVVSDYQNFAGSVGPGAAALAHYDDLLSYHAFRNYKDLLTAVTFHPMMAYWLTYINSAGAQSTTDAVLHPDENYAREILQLFAIGLNELNLDGTPKLTSEGLPKPTYTQEDVRQLARIFTGMQLRAGLQPVDLLPLKVTAGMHDKRSKTFLGFHRDANASQSAAEAEREIRDAVAHIATLPSVAPFISRQLIQHLVTSNPSTGYVRRVATVFQAHSGSADQLGRVVRAILTDAEARSADTALFSASHGRLKDPIQRQISLMRAFQAGADYSSGAYDLRNTTQNPLDGPLWSWTHWVDNNTTAHPFYDYQQHPFISPTVFSFYAPGYSPAGVVFNARLLGPEFQILNSATVSAGIGRLWNDTSSQPIASEGQGVPGFNSRYQGGILNNLWRQALFTEADTLTTDLSLQGKALRLHFEPTNGRAGTHLPASPTAQDIATFIGKLDTLLCAGRMSPSTRSALSAFLTSPPTGTAYLDPTDTYRLERAAVQWLWALPEAALVR
jgi:uncharacterized protein (DUF1800 family)